MSDTTSLAGTFARDDEQLLGALRGVLAAADPLPPLVLEAARAAFTTRRLDEELAELVADTAAGVAAGALVRGPATATRLLSFEAAGSAVELEVERDGALRHLLGQVIGEVDGPVHVDVATGTRAVEVDPLGRFAARDLPAGEVRLRYREAGGPAVTTGWVAI